MKLLLFGLAMIIQLTTMQAMAYLPINITCTGSSKGDITVARLKTPAGYTGDVMFVGPVAGKSTVIIGAQENDHYEKPAYLATCEKYCSTVINNYVLKVDSRDMEHSSFIIDNSTIVGRWGSKPEQPVRCRSLSRDEVKSIQRLGYMGRDNAG